MNVMLFHLMPYSMVAMGLALPLDPPGILE